MILGKTVLGIIPARGGSKGIPRKNILNIAGKPLIAWTIEAAKKSQYLDRLILSSEDEEIIEVARNWGCEVPFKRPAELSQDETPGITPVLHALEQISNYDYVILLQPTSPLRQVIDIDNCLETCINNHSFTAVSVVEVEENPYWMYTLEATGKMQPVIPTANLFNRRQDLPKVYRLNGAVYVAKVDWLLEHKKFIDHDTIGYVMPPERSLDLDTQIDLKQLQLILKEMPYVA